MNKKAVINKLETGIPGLDTVLGGGISEFSFNLLGGTPGSGKTTLAHQLMFSIATPAKPALYFTVLGEPTLKMLRYQQQFSFFDLDKAASAIRFVNLADDVIDGDYDKVLTRILQEVKDYQPGLVIVDSFRSLIHTETQQHQGATDLQLFVQRLAMQMATWQATTFLIGEFNEKEGQGHPVATIADGILWLSQNVHRNSVIRKIQALKTRGQGHSPGLHTFRISSDGLEIFPRTIVPRPRSTQRPIRPAPGNKRLSTGVPALDAMLGGGIPEGYSVLVVGPTGSGKTVLATSFLAEGMRCGETGVIAAFEKSPDQLLSTTLDEMVQSGKVALVDTHSLDLSIDETLHNLVIAIKSLDAKRVVIDSLSGFELALAPPFQEDFRESLYRLVATLTGMGVTVLMTTELEDRFTELRFSPYGSAFLTDAIIVQRYVEHAGQLQRVVAVAKLRGSSHSKDFRLFDIEGDQFVVSETACSYNGILSGGQVNTRSSDCSETPAE